MNKKVFNKILTISLCVITFLFMLIFIIQVYRLGDEYDERLVNKYLFQMLPVFILWLITFITSLFFEIGTKKEIKLPKIKTFKVSKITKIIIDVVFALIILGCATCTIGYLAQSKHFSSDISDNAKALGFYLLPFGIIALVSTVIWLCFEREDKKVKYTFSSNLALTITLRAIVFLAAIVFITVGAIYHQQDSVLNKAILICLECIGIG